MNGLRTITAIVADDNKKNIRKSDNGNHFIVVDCDAAIKRAADAGATVTMPAADMFWGDRYGTVDDPFGHRWSFATHISDPTPEEITAAAEAMFAK